MIARLWTDEVYADPRRNLFWKRQLQTLTESVVLLGLDLLPEPKQFLLFGDLVRQAYGGATDAQNISATDLDQLMFPRLLKCNAIGLYHTYTCEFTSKSYFFF